MHLNLVIPPDLRDHLHIIINIVVRRSVSVTNPSLWLAVVPVILYDRPTPPQGGEGLSKLSPEPLLVLHVTASGISQCMGDMHDVHFIRY